MKKMIAVFLCLVLCLGAFAPSVAESLAGGWTFTEDAAVTDEAKEALEKALEGFVGSGITPVALIGTQVVAGLNYCLLCRVTPVVPNAVGHYALVYVYSPVNGEQPQILRIQDLELSAQEPEAAE